MVTLEHPAMQVSSQKSQVLNTETHIPFKKGKIIITQIINISFHTVFISPVL